MLRISDPQKGLEHMGIIFKKYKTFFRVDIQLYQHDWRLEKRETVWKHDARRAERRLIIALINRLSVNYCIN